ncbi:baseplate J/gp47 family protein [Candidatus Daviesbacteria bacterium]|nr:baseplate J/gp47 family protein [Candidatus Daviesbacteria bacterium]
MNFLDRLTALILFGKKEEVVEYFFALNIANEQLICALWTIEKKQLKILDIAYENCSSSEDLIPTTDKLLDKVLGVREIEPQKILFGIPSFWLSDGNLKSEKLSILRKLVKELELVPMAYVENSLAVAHFLEKTDGVPPTAILVGFETDHLTVSVVRAGKLDGVKIVQRGESSGADIERALLTFVGVETLPSKILIYNYQVSSESGQIEDLKKIRNQLLSYSWMSKLSFLHFPKIELLKENIEIKSICLAGASEIESNIFYYEVRDSSHYEQAITQSVKKTTVISPEEEEVEEIKGDTKVSKDTENADLGFVVGDVSAVSKEEEEVSFEENQDENNIEEAIQENELAVPLESDMVMKSPVTAEKQIKDKFSLQRFIMQVTNLLIPKKFGSIALLVTFIGALLIILGAYLFLLKAEVKIFVEPKVLEKDAEVIADPNQKVVDEDAKVIPGQIVDTEISGSAKDQATGKKQIGDAAKGTVKIINNTDEGRSFSKGTILTTSSGLKFTLNSSASVSATPADADSKSTKTVEVIAAEIGADGNLPSGTNLTVSNLPTSQIAVKAEGNFSGGTSKDVTVVSSDDQKKLLASLASDLRKQAQVKLQEKLPQKKILEEALSEEIIKKSFSKNINDQASEISLNLTAKYKGIAFEDKDLKLIVSKLVTTQVPEGFRLNLEDTETQANVSKLEKDGKLIFLARFRAKLLPKIDTEKIKSKIKGKSANEAISTIKNMEDILGSEIQISPKLPTFLQRLPILGNNISIEVGLK